ncbi:hypothetical protein AJ78_08161 [Emergomyces pasteurianus Ep9510]|uniref:Uncharacterized protein n=1 Tax=Emergomyces pasteurianus Ep9510 TaxID=1447872 RepID=A0A1J9P2H3_9EURO|nr:hypothetical protein AJ78_08161 [Emergomyces pasteurianus Ep9510]
MQRYGTLLQQAQIASEPMPNSPPQSINTKSMFALRFDIYIQSRLRHALRAGSLAPQLPNLHLTPTTVNIGDAATIIDNYRPDIAFFQAGSPLNSSPNRCPGDLKVSWKWGSGYRTSLDPGDHRNIVHGTVSSCQTLSWYRLKGLTGMATYWLHRLYHGKQKGLGV